MFQFGNSYKLGHFSIVSLALSLAFAKMRTGLTYPDHTLLLVTKAKPPKQPSLMLREPS